MEDKVNRVRTTIITTLMTVHILLLSASAGRSCGRFVKCTHVPLVFMLLLRLKFLNTFLSEHQVALREGELVSCDFVLAHSEAHTCFILRGHAL